MYFIRILRMNKFAAAISNLILNLDNLMCPKRPDVGLKSYLDLSFCLFVCLLLFFFFFVGSFMP